MEELKRWYLSRETHGIYPEDIPEYLDSKDSSEEDEDEWDFYYEEDYEYLEEIADGND